MPGPEPWRRAHRSRRPNGGDSPPTRSHGDYPTDPAPVNDQAATTPRGPVDDAYRRRGRLAIKGDPAPLTDMPEQSPSHTTEDGETPRD